jgi:hypothetical protein
MDYDPDNDPTNYPNSDKYPEQEKSVNVPSFGEILRHAWPVLWEKPVAFLLFALFIVVILLAMDFLTNALLEPYAPYFESVLNMPGAGESEPADMADLLKEHGVMRIFLAFLAPFLLITLLNLTMCRGALSMWDGYSPSSRDFTMSLSGYPKALAFSVIYALCWSFIFFLIFFLCIPGYLILQFAGPNFGVVSFLIAAIITFVLFITLLWRIVKPFFFFQFFFFFVMADHPLFPNFLNRAVGIFFDLRKWPRYLNSMVGYAFLIFLGVSIPMEFLIMALRNVLSYYVLNALANFVLILAYMWFLTALAGFHRICLYPLDQIPPANYQEGAQPTNPS